MTNVDDLAGEVEDLRYQLGRVQADVRQVEGRHRATPNPYRAERDTRKAWEKAAARSLAHRKHRILARVRRWVFVGTVWVVITGIAAVVWGKGSPWAPDTAALSCGNVSAAPAAPGTPAQPDPPPTESIAVRTARVNGWLLHKLTGPPPDPKGTAAAAEAAGRAAVVSILAFRATAQGKKDPAVVSRYNAAYAKRKATEAQNAAAKCNPCPQAGTGGTMTVGWTAPATANQDAERTARAAAAAAGFTGRHLDEALAVAWLESGFNPTARNPRSSAAGVWQIMRSAHSSDPDIGRWADPYASARMAYRISRGGTDWAPWSVWPQAQRSLTTTAAQPVAACTAPSQYRTGAGVAWGGYQNGRIPVTALAHPASAPRHLLRPDAAAAFDRLSAAYRARFGRPLGVTDSYRSYAAQVDVKGRKPGLAATPGTSDHGWGLALDLVVGGYGSTDYLWFRANAPAFGWDNPPWARPGGSKNEPWHFEFQPIGART